MSKTSSIITLAFIINYRRASRFSFPSLKLNNSKHSTRKSGQTLIIAITLLSVMLIVGTAIISFSEQSLIATRHSYKTTQCLSLAEAGIDYGIRHLNIDSDYPGTSSPVNLGNGQFEIAVNNTGSLTRELTSTAYIPAKANYEIKKILRADINTNNVNIQFPYGVQAGEGGISMENNAKIIGDVYSNGSIEGSAGNSISGNAIVATDNSIAPITWNVYNSDLTFGKTDPVLDIAQSFVADRTETMGKIALYLKKVGNPSDISIRILGKKLLQDEPLKSAQVSSGTLAATGVTSNYSWIEIPLSNGLLISGVKYWITIDAGKDINNYWQIGTDNTDSFPGNTCLTTDDWSKNNATWSQSNADINFKLYYGGSGNRIKDVNVGQDAYVHNFSGGDVGRDFYGYRYTGDWTEHEIGGDAYAEELLLCRVHGNAYANTNLCVVDGDSQGGSGIPDHAPGGYAITQANIDDFKSHAAETSANIINGDFSPTSSTVTLGPAQINGNLNLINNQHLVLTGTLYVTGKINFALNNIISLDPGYGPSSGMIITDQTVYLPNNVIFEGSGSSYPNTYILLITTSNSMNIANPAISVNNNTNAAILYAPYGLIDLSNNVKIKETMGMKINLHNGAEITYESALQNILFTTGPSGGWRMKPGSWREILN